MTSTINLGLNSRGVELLKQQNARVLKDSEGREWIEFETNGSGSEGYQYMGTTFENLQNGYISSKNKAAQKTKNLSTFKSGN